MPKEPGGPERLAAAGCALVHNRPADALAWLDDPGKAGPLAPYRAWFRARALLELGQRAEALKTAKGVSLPGRSGLQLQLLAARIQADLAYPEAQEALAALTGTPMEHEARFWAAEGLGVAGDSDGHVDVLVSLWTAAAPEGWDTRAADRLEDLSRPVPALGSATGREQALVRAENLRKANRHVEALELLLAIRAVQPAATQRDQVALARSHASARRYAEALPHWEKVLGPPETASGSAQHLFDCALTHARTGDYDTATGVYRRLMAQHPSSSQAEFASYKLGYMEYDRDRCDTASTLLRDHIRDHPDSKRLDEALWFISRCQWRAGAYTDAVESLTQLRAQRPKSSLVPGAAYWQARALGIGGDISAEEHALKRVLASWPTSGYAWFAATRAGISFPAREQISPPGWPSNLAEQDAVIRGEALLSVGLRDLARAELAQVDPGASRIAKLALAWARIRAGDYRAGKRLAKPFCVSPWKDGDPVAQQACLPMPEATAVADAANPYGLDPLLPYGIMTAESALKPEVTSIAGARGLMQLMPEIAAQRHADLYPDRPFDADDLYSAPYNATLGTTELGRLHRALGEVLTVTSLPAVIASYNGGEEAVRRWLADDSEPPDFDAFAEDISYTETRRYVKRVLGFVMAYRWVYGDPADSESTAK